MVQPANFEPRLVIMVPDPEQSVGLFIPSIAHLAVRRQAFDVINDAQDFADRGDATACHWRTSKKNCAVKNNGGNTTPHNASVLNYPNCADCMIGRLPAKSWQIKSPWHTNCRDRPPTSSPPPVWRSWAIRSPQKDRDRLCRWLYSAGARGPRTHCSSWSRNMYPSASMKARCRLSAAPPWPPSMFS